MKQEAPGSSKKVIAAMAKLIEIRDLHSIGDDGTVFFAEAHAEFCSGESVAIIGPHDQGKTGLMRLFLGLDRPQRGRVFIFGMDIGMLERSELDRLRQEIGVVFEDATLISNLKVIENVMLPLQYHTDMASDNILKKGIFLLNYVGYKGDIWDLPGPLSFYTKKIIALARAMALNPAIMIYDRPLKGLDVYHGSQILRFVNEFHKGREDRLSIVIANDEEDVKDIALDRILRIENRRIL